MAEKKVIIEIEIDKKSAEAGFIATEKAIRKIKAEQDALRKSIKATETAQGEATDEQIKTLGELENKLKNLSQERARELADLKNNANSIQSLRNEIAKLTTEYNNLDTSTSEGSARFGELQGRLKELNESLQEATAASGNFKDSIGKYKDNVKDAINETSFFGVSIGQMANAFNTAKMGIFEASGALNVFKIALISTGIGAILVAFGLFITYITQTQSGIDRMAQIMAKLTKAIQPLISAISFLGELVFNVFEGAVDVVVGLADSFNSIAFGTKSASSEAANYVKDLQNIERALQRQEVANAKSFTLQEDLKNIRDNELKSTKERKKANEELSTLILKQLNDTLKLENEKLDRLQKELELKPKNLRTDEDIKKVNEQIVKIEGIKADIAGKINETITNRVSLIKEEFDQVSRVADAQLAVDKLKIKGFEGSQKGLNAEIALILKKRDNELKFQEDQQVRQAIALEAEASVLEKKKEFNDKQIELAKEFNDKQKELRLKNLDDEIAALNTQAFKFEENTKERLKFETAIIEVEAKKQLIEAGNNAKQIAFINADKLDKIKKRTEEVNKEVATKTIESQISTQQTLLNLAEENSQSFFKIQEELAKKNAELQIVAAGDNAEKQKEIQSQLVKDLQEINTNAKVAEKDALIKSQENVQKILNEGTLLRLNADLALIKSNKDKNLLTAKSEEERFGIEEEARQLSLEKEKEFKEKQNELILKFGFERVKAQNSQELSRAFTKGEIDKFEVQSEASKLNAIGSIAAGFGALFGKQSEIAKIGAGANALLNTYTSITQVLADPLVPTFAKIPTAIGIGVQGFAQVANIAGIGIDVTEQTAGLAQIATGVGAIAPVPVPNIFEPPAFAMGGLIEGQGTGTSDSILAKVSNGESIINAKSTQMFAPILSSINQAGGGRAFAMGGIATAPNSQKVQNDFNFGSILKTAFANMPSPQVSVVDIQNVTKRVNVKETTTSL